MKGKVALIYDTPRRSCKKHSCRDTRDTFLSQSEKSPNLAPPSMFALGLSRWRSPEDE